MGSAIGSQFSEPFATGRRHWQVAEKVLSSNTISKTIHEITRINSK
jgi:hypothetical protein